MKSKKLTKSATIFLIATFLFSVISLPVSAAPKVVWQQSVDGVYNTNIPGMILMFKDELAFGGMDLYSGKMTNSKASADIAYYEGTIAARDIIDLGEIDFDKVDTVPDQGYSQEQKAVSGHVYIVSTSKGEFAKIKIKSVMASSVLITYAIIKETKTEPTADNQKNPDNQIDIVDIIDDTDYTVDLKLNTFDDIKSTINVEEGNNPQIKWDRAEDISDESYDIYRSDNGGAFEKLNDLRLSENEYIDEECKVGRYYLYRVIAFNEYDNVTKVYPLFKATILKKQLSISMKIGSPIVKINGVDKNLSTAPALVKNKVLIPASYLTPMLNAKVLWNSKTKVATISYNNTNVVLTLNSTTAAVNNKKVTLDAPLQMVSNKLMIPVNLLGSAFNLKVAYTSSTKAINITSAQTQSAPVPPAASGLEYAFKTFILWVPGTSYSVANYQTSTNTIYTSPGTVPKSTITINKNGTYVWNSAWDDKIINGSWTASSDGSINLTKGQEGKTWKLAKSKGITEDIFIMDGSTWYSGKAVTVQTK